jgi:hypothetical protein
MAKEDSQARKKITNLVRVLGAMKKAYPVSASGTLYRSVYLPVGKKSNDDLMKIKSWKVGKGPVTSWSKSKTVTEKWYRNIADNDQRERLSSEVRNDFASLLLAGKMAKYSAMTVDTALQFFADSVACYSQLTPEKVGNPQSLLSRMSNYYPKRIGRPFILKQQEVVCLTGTAPVPCRIDRILFRGNMVGYKRSKEQSAIPPYAKAQRVQTLLEEKVAAANKAMRRFSHDANGLIPTHIKESPEYQAAKKAHERAISELRAYITVFKNVYKQRAVATTNSMIDPTTDSGRFSAGHSPRKMREPGEMLKVIQDRKRAGRNMKEDVRKLSIDWPPNHPT